MSDDRGRFEIAARDLQTTVRYAGASGDYNPLHYDQAAAERAGFARVLVHGGWLAAHCEYLLAPLADYRSMSVRFERPVMIGESLSLDWSRDDLGVEGVLSGDGVRRVTARLDHEPPVYDRPNDWEQVIDPYPWVIEEGALRLFVEAVAGNRWAEVKLPLSFMLNSGRWSPAKGSIVQALGFSYDRMLHGTTQTDVFGALPQQGDSFTVSTAYANRTAKPHREGGTMRFADIVSEIADESGEPRIRITNRFIERPKRG
ncbi:MAG: hypothetical protein KGZ65_15035 [Sphingomonadales bacterium]|nr:hypothetical protein [Sphingomonadaceae bacterium]MBS3932539.1 hypothetical protein [Sphingomonadales bacterium]